MEAVNPNKAGLVFGLLLGGWHSLWALLVAVGFAQPLINFIFWAHFIKPIYVIGDFKLWIAVVLIAVTATIGYIIGCVLATLWNWIHR